MPNAIAVTLLANYFPVLVLFLESAKRSYRQRPEIVVCQKGFSSEQIRFLETRYSPLRTIDVTTHSFPKGPAMLHREGLDADAFYARFLIWTDLFDAYDNVLYLDVDALVTGSLEPLLLSSEFLCFNESYAGPQSLFYDSTDPTLLQLLEEDGLTHLLSTVPGNAGVQLIPPRYRTPAHLAELHRLLNRYRDFFIWGDQSLLNLWMARNGLKPTPDFRFNFQVRLLEQMRAPEAYRDVRFFHMNGWNHLPCVEYLVQSTFVFFFLLPGGRRLYPSYIRLMVRQDMLRVTYGFRTFLRWTEIFRRTFWRLGGIPPAILYRSDSQLAGSRARQVCPTNSPGAGSSGPRSR